MSLKRRLERLEQTASSSGGHPVEEVWAAPAAYARLREDTRAEIEEDLELGAEPLFRIDDEGIVRASSDGRPVRHIGDYFRVLNEYEETERKATRGDDT